MFRRTKKQTDRTGGEKHQLTAASKGGNVAVLVVFWWLLCCGCVSSLGGGPWGPSPSLGSAPALPCTLGQLARYGSLWAGGFLQRPRWAGSGLVRLIDWLRTSLPAFGTPVPALGAPWSLCVVPRSCGVWWGLLGLSVSLHFRYPAQPSPLAAFRTVADVRPDEDLLMTASRRQLLYCSRAPDPKRHRAGSVYQAVGRALRTTCSRYRLGRTGRSAVGEPVDMLTWHRTDYEKLKFSKGSCWELLGACWHGHPQITLAPLG